MHSTVDLLERGRMTGQTARLLYNPPRREWLELEAAKAKQVEEQSKMSKKGGAAGKAREGAATKMADKPKVPEPVQSPEIHPDEDEEEEEEEEMQDVAPVPSRYWFSLVCYGLPNLAVSGKN